MALLHDSAPAVWIRSDMTSIGVFVYRIHLKIVVTDLTFHQAR